MERLYEAENPKTEGLSNPNEVMDKVNLVGLTASREVAEVLERCYAGIEHHFSAISTVKRRRGDPKETWQIKFRIFRKNSKKKKYFEIGIYINSSESAFGAWIWCPGGRRAEDELVAILGRGEKAAALRAEGWHPGNIRLANFRIHVPERLDEPVECDSLVGQVQDVFASFTETHVNAIATIANGS
jgi:hypothetical protein